MADTPEISNVNAGDQETTTDQQGQGTGPVGEGEYVVKQGDCISSIGMEVGHFPDTIWDDAANSELKTLRENPNTLLPGDCVTIPPLRRKEEPGDTEMLHRFRRKGQPETLRIRLLDMFDNPRKDVPYTITIDGEFTSSTTDANGELSLTIAPNARKGTLVIDEDEEEIQLHLGKLDPITEISGVQARLSNLCYDIGPIDGELGPRTEEAIQLFQRQHELDETGESDQATQDKIEELHGH